MPNNAWKHAALALALVALPASACSSARSAGPAIMEGSLAPDVGGLTQDGRELRLSSLRGKYVVLYFYPKDHTPGCTRQACNFRDEHRTLQELGAVVVGVSTDDVRSHQAFATKHRLPFPLIADPQKTIARAFGVPIRFGFAARTTFIIDPDGVVRRVFRGVDPRSSEREVIAALHKLGAGLRGGAR